MLKGSWKKGSCFPQKYLNCLNIDNNLKCVLSSKSAYYNYSVGSCDTEDWSNDAENSALTSQNKLHLKYIILIIFLSIAVLTIFFDQIIVW